MNKQTMSVAEKIKVEKLFQIQNDVFGIKQPKKTIEHLMTSSTNYGWKEKGQE